MVHALYRTAYFTVLFLAFGLISPSSGGEGVPVAVVVSQDSGPYRETLAGFQKYLRSVGFAADVSVFTLTDDPSSAEQAIEGAQKNRPALFFTLGTVATRAVLEKIRNTPVIYGMVMRPDKLEYQTNATGVSLEFPVDTQFRMLRRLLPNVRTVGVIYNPEENMKAVDAASAAAREMGLRLSAHEVFAPRDLPSAMANLSKDADVLWGLADSMVINVQTAKQILLFSHRYRIPFIGLSEAWVKSGALYALDRDYADIGAQCAELAVRVSKGANAGAISPVAPRKVVYSLNMKTAERMKVRIPEALLKGAHQVY